MYLIYEAANASLGIQLAEKYREADGFDVVLWSPYCLPNEDKIREASASAGCLFVAETGAKGGLADIHSVISPWIVPRPKPPTGAFERCEDLSNRGAELLKLLTPDQRMECVYAVDDIRRRRWFCEDIIARLAIDAIVMAEDNPERDSAIWISAARSRGCRTVIISYGDLDVNEALSAYSQSEAHLVPENLVGGMRSVMPEWMAQAGEKWISRLPYAQAIARVLTHCTATNPWVVNSGPVDAIGVESPAMRDVYRQLGIPSDHLHVVGHPVKDLLHQKLVQHTSRRRQFGGSQTHGTPSVVVAIPTDYTDLRSTEFGGYASVQDAFLYPLRDILQANIIVSLHPNAKEAHRERLIGLGFQVAREPLVEILPLCDLYVASVSSTIKWALGCGIPVLNYDVYEYHYEQYRTSQAVRTVSTIEDYRDALRSWQEEEPRSEWIAAARSVAGYWGPIDGQSTNRVLRLIWSK